MHTYWDLEPKARAALSSEDVERFVDAELMLKGVLKVDPPIYDEEPAMPELDFATWYKVGGHACLFPTAEAALKFIDLGPREASTKYVGDDWRSRESIQYLTTEATGEILPVKVVTEAQLAVQKSAIDRRGAATKANRDKSEEFEKATKAQTEALQGLWDDWYARRDEAARHRKVVDTYEAYAKTAGGDATIAAKFLLKVFSATAINDAAEWFETSIPTAFAAPDEPAPAPAPDVTSDNDAVF